MKNMTYNSKLGKWIMPSNVRDLLKNWDTNELVEAMGYAQEKTLELNPTSAEYKMWLMRQLAYADELNRRAN